MAVSYSDGVAHRVYSICNFRSPLPHYLESQETPKENPMKRSLLRFITASGLLGLVMSGCILHNGYPLSVYYGVEKDSTRGGISSFLEAQAYWDGDSVSGKSSMVLNLTQQMIFYYKGDQLVGITPACTGKEGCSTPIGTFRVTQKDVHHVSTLYGDFVDVDGKVVIANINSRYIPPYGNTFRGAPMPFFMRLYGGIGIHGGFLPGVPDSHGCIRIPNKMAEIFFQNTPLGTLVSVVHK